MRKLTIWLETPPECWWDNDEQMVRFSLIDGTQVSMRYHTFLTLHASMNKLIAETERTRTVAQIIELRAPGHG